MSDVNRPPVRKVWLVSLFIGIGLFLLLLIGRGGLEAESQESFLVKRLIKNMILNMALPLFRFIKILLVQRTRF